MVLSLATKIFGSSNERALKKYHKHVDPINALEPTYAAMSDDELKQQTEIFRKRLEEGEALGARDGALEARVACCCPELRVPLP